ncbi:MAG TPA: glycosyltransferase family 9 protein [Edaphobacter sp.]|jgi:ADP-heptose:LPS heptosyltransferase
MNGTPTNLKQSPVQRVLIYRLGSLGDTLVALPAFHLIARVFPNAERRLLTNFPVNVKAPPAAAILENTGLVAGFFRYTVGTRNPVDLMRLWWTLIRWRPDVLVYVGPARGIESARRDETFFRLCGIRKLIGIPVVEEMQQNRWDEETQTFEPEAVRLVRNLASLGEESLEDPASWDLRLTLQECAKADQLLGSLATSPFIAVSVGTKMQAKDWGRENWRAFLAKLATSYPGYGLALCGAPEENEASEFAAEGWRQAGGGECVNLCGLLTPRESGAVFRRAEVFVGHDSGPMHLAAAVQTPCVAIFAARNKPRVWFPYGKSHRVIYHKTECWGCNLETCIVEKKRCLTSITVDEVVGQVRTVLG